MSLLQAPNIHLTKPFEQVSYAFVAHWPVSHAFHPLVNGKPIVYVFAWEVTKYISILQLSYLFINNDTCLKMKCILYVITESTKSPVSFNEY